MIYIYDILLNFCDNDLIYDFYEWSNNDNVENIKRIKLIHISRNAFDDLLNYECIIDNNYLVNFYRTCEVYQAKKIRILDYAFLISDGERVIALEVNKNGSIMYKSKLLLDEEDEIAILAGNLEITDLMYDKKKLTLKNRFFTRKENIIRNYLFKEIDDSYKNKKYDKLKFLYQEYFDKSISSYKNIRTELLNSIKDKIDDKHKELYNLLRLGSKKKQV